MAESQKRIQNEGHVAPYDGSGAMETAYKKKMMRSVVFIDTKSVIHSRGAVKVHTLDLYQRVAVLCTSNMQELCIIGVVYIEVACVYYRSCVYY